MGKISYKKANEFREAVLELLTKFGAEKSELYQYKIKTENLGDLYISLHDDSLSYCYSIFTRFEDVDKAKQYVDCNPFSGKFNFHSGSSKTILSDFTRFLHMHGIEVEKEHLFQ